jgi:hypothetical protein
MYFVPFFGFFLIFYFCFFILPTLATISLYLSVYGGANIVMPLCAGAARLVSPAEFP